MKLSQYNELVNQHFFAPCNLGEFAASVQNVKTVQAGQRASGALIQLQVVSVNHTIVDVRYKVYGCVATIASCSWLSEYIKGETLAFLSTIDCELIMQKLQLPLAKRHRILIVLEALKKIMEKLC